MRTKFWTNSLLAMSCAAAIGFSAALVAPSEAVAGTCDDQFGSPKDHGCVNKLNAVGEGYVDGDSCRDGYKLDPWCKCKGGTMWGDNCYLNP